MTKITKTLTLFVLLCGFLVVSSTILSTNKGTCIDPFDDDPEDPGNSNGPTLGSIDTIIGNFELLCVDNPLLSSNLVLY